MDCFNSRNILYKSVEPERLARRYRIFLFLICLLNWIDIHSRLGCFLDVFCGTCWLTEGKIESRNFPQIRTINICILHYQVTDVTSQGLKVCPNCFPVTVALDYNDILCLGCLVRGNRIQDWIRTASCIWSLRPDITLTFGPGIGV